MAAGHVLNLTPSANANRIPYEDFHHMTAHGLAKQLHVFGCLTWVHLPKKDHTATFHEHKGWHNRPKVQSLLQIGFESLKAESAKPEANDLKPEPEIEELDKQDSLQHAPVEQPINNTEDNRLEIAVEDMIRGANTTTLNLTPTMKEALASEDAQQWQEAICKELDGLEAMGTWEIVDVPPNTKLVDSKIILCLKLDADGVPVQHKARLVT
ncbi:hypothetical protein NDA15_002949 [Ustilago hordei]|nr:hypothetical protein NDA15_002949 [Ustilago hordei]